MIVNANALHLPIASKSVQCVVTSPPYFGLRDYGVAGQIGLEQSPDDYVQSLVVVFREVWRVLKDDGTLWLNLGDSYAQDTKWGGASGGKNYTSASGGIPLKHINTGLKPKDLIGIPWRVAFALQADGWYLRRDIIWNKPNCMPESVKDRPTTSHEYVFLLSKSEKYYYNAEEIREPFSTSDSHRSSSVWVAGWATDGEHNAISHNVPKSYHGSKFQSGRKLEIHSDIGQGQRYENPVGRNSRSVWTIPTQPTSYAHFATMPEKLVEPCILAGSRPGDYVLDPFMGSGTVDRVAIRLGRKGIGTELNYKYISEIASRRTKNIQVYLPLEATP